MDKHSWLTLVAACALALVASTARAQETETYHVERVERVETVREPYRPHVLIEATGSYGLQLGTTDYLPAGAVGDWQHPFVHGFGVGATAGVFVDPQIALIANYEYSNARTMTGSLTGVIDEVQGTIDYHTLVAGMRVMAPLPFGAFQAEFAGGVVFPYQTELDIDHGPVLAQLPTPITGTGTRISHYSVGVGGHGLIGYRLPLGDMFYLALNLKIRVFETENSGETTEYRNFVTDYNAVPPTATTATVPNGDGAARPSTSVAADGRLQLAVGANF